MHRGAWSDAIQASSATPTLQVADRPGNHLGGPSVGVEFIRSMVCATGDYPTSPLACKERVPLSSPVFARLPQTCAIYSVRRRETIESFQGRSNRNATPPRVVVQHQLSALHRLDQIRIPRTVPSGLQVQRSCSCIAVSAINQTAKRDGSAASQFQKQIPRRAKGPAGWRTSGRFAIARA